MLTRPALRRALILILTLAAFAPAAELPGKPDPDAIVDAERSMKGFAIPEGFEIRLFAAEPLLGNPVSICLDEQDRVYVAETYRFGKGVGDNRGHGYWLLDDLAAQTVEDRLAYYKKWTEKGKKKWTWFTDNQEIIRRIVDTDGDGKADRSTVFADGFNDPLDGLAAGLIARDGNVYLTCIPNLWLLQDKDDDGKADVKKSLQRGFGVRTALLGHDLHGLVWGPDGRLYFSIGDRGYSFTTKEGRKYHSPGSGAVFRCEPDGSNLEVFATGLRNPQELAFDQFGNLWAGDNNSDAGDAARLVYVVQGGETGWHMSYQTMGNPYSRGPWHMDRLWHTQHENQPAWILPPIAHIGGGPSGLAYYPGVGLPERYENHFFMCDFHGSPGNSRIESWTVKPKGAGFEIDDDHTFVNKVLATDVAFGHDGSMYISDWINGWGGTGKGRIYTLSDPKSMADPAVAETKRLFREGFKMQSTETLGALLGHKHMMVRQRAQFELAARGAQAELESVAADARRPRSARMHAVWALWQTGRGGKPATRTLTSLLQDADDEVRVQALRVIRDLQLPTATAVMPLLQDDNARVRFFAVMALGALKHEPAVEPLLAILRDNKDRDVFLRHACVMGLVGCADADTLVARANDPDRSARLGILLALRRFKDPRIAMFLKDADEFLVTEAARAIHDLPIPEAMAALAEAISRHTSDAPAAVADASDKPFQREFWEQPPGGAMTDVVKSRKPNRTERSKTFEVPRNVADHYVARVTGTIEAPETGGYRFFLSADDAAEFYLSIDGDPEHKKQIVATNNWMPPNKWIQSDQIQLKKSQKLYLELLHREGGGDDHAVVGWRLPGGTMQRPIGAGDDRGVQSAGGGSGANESLMRRAINANFRLGTAEGVKALAAFAANDRNPDNMRLEALAALGDWVEPNPRDRVLGYHRPLPKRDEKIIRDALQGALPRVLARSSGSVEAEATKLTARYKLATDPATFLKWVGDSKRPVTTRLEALRLLASRKDAQLKTAVDAALQSDAPLLRAEARDLLVNIDSDRALSLMFNHQGLKTTLEKQRAIAGLAALKRSEADTFLSIHLEMVQEGKQDPALILDTLEAVRARAEASAELKKRLQAYEAGLSKSDPLAAYRPALHGGDAARGAELFQNHQAAQCFRCHKVKGVGGGDTGPDLGKLGGQQPRQYILESLVNPSAQIAKGFEMVVLTLKNGSVVAGTVVEEKDGAIVVAPPAMAKVTVKAADVQARTSQKISAMPPMGAILKPRELRDLIEYLAQQK